MHSLYHTDNFCTSWKPLHMADTQFLKKMILNCNSYSTEEYTIIQIRVGKTDLLSRLEKYLNAENAGEINEFHC